MVKILCIDDEIENITALQFILAKKFDLILVDNYKDAFDTIEKDNDIKIIISDYRMPEKDGITLLGEFFEKYPDKIRILLTAYADIDIMADSVNIAHIYYFIAKPIKIQEFELVINNAIELINIKEREKRLEEEKIINEKKLLRSERLASLGTLSSSIAHEIRQPLQLIKVIADTVNLRIKKKKNKDIIDNKNYSNIIELIEGVEKINKIINNMQRLIKSSGEIQQNRININSVIENLIDLYTEKFKNHLISIHLDLDKNLPPVIGEDVLIQQIIGNILNNAIDALDSVKKIDKIIKITTTTTNERSISIDIMNNGPKIEVENKEKIFDPLYSTKVGKESMGMGLFIVYNIIQSLGGNIEIIDNEDEGVTFRLNLKRGYEK